MFRFLKPVIPVFVALCLLLTDAVSASASSLYRLDGVRTPTPAATLGAVVPVSSSFYTSRAGTFVFDTEVYLGTSKVGQWHESKTVAANQLIVLNYQFDTTGRALGTYTFKQGLFAEHWASTLSWRESAGSLTLQAPKWELTASTPTSAVVGTKITATGKFKAPLSGRYLLDVEVYGPQGHRISQVFGNYNVTQGQTQEVPLQLDTAGLPLGTYVVQLGAFGADWNGTQSWNSSASNFKLVAAGAWKATALIEGTRTVGSTLTVKASFQSPVATTALLDVEVYRGTQKVWQHYVTRTFTAGQTQLVTASMPTGGFIDGAYVIKLGAFGENWSGTRLWVDAASTFNLSKPVPTTAAPAPTTTRPPVTTTTTTRPATTTTRPPTTTIPTTTTTRPPTTTIPPTTTTQPPTTAPTNPSNPFTGAQLYLDRTNFALMQADAWASTRPADADAMRRMGNVSTAVWIGDWTADVTGSVNQITSAATAAGQVPIFIAYNIPGRDCGSFSAGGAASMAAYESWIDKFAAGIGNRRAVVILEPDALPMLTSCLDQGGQANRLAMLKYAVDKFSGNPNAAVYLDAGHPNWMDVNTMSSRLAGAGIAKARGFALNVSNYVDTPANLNYGDQLARLTGKHYIVDTSRNGNGSNGEWCNPTGRALGRTPTTSTGSSLADAFVWLKRPGESDGSCNGGPPAGQWWAEYALGLARAAGW